MTLDQYTKCQSVSANGNTCHNPKIRYGKTSWEGVPEIGEFGSWRWRNGLQDWCKQLEGTFVNVTKGKRDGGVLIWGTGGDEPAAKWIPRLHDTWYNGTISYHKTPGEHFITSITCN